MADLPKRPPTVADLANAIHMTNAIERRHRPIVSLFGSLLILGIIGSSFVVLNSASGTLFPGGPAVGPNVTGVTLIVSLSLIGIGVLGLLGCAIANGLWRRRLDNIGKATDLAELPVNDLFEGDVLGPWTVIDSDADSLHATLPGTQVRALARRFGAFALAIALVTGVGATIYTMSAPAPSAATQPSAGASGGASNTKVIKKKSSKSKPGFSALKGLFWAVAGSLWLFRWSLRPVAFQWLLTNPGNGPRIEIHRLRLFRRTDIASIPAHDIAEFTLVEQRLSLVHGVQPIEIAAVSTGPLGRWQAACIATALMARLDPSRRVSLTISGKANPKPTSCLIPAELASECPFAVTTERQEVPEAALRDLKQAPPEPALPPPSTARR